MHQPARAQVGGGLASARPEGPYRSFTSSSIPMLPRTDRALASRQTCMAAVFHGAGQPLQLTQFEIPSVAAGEAIARIECCTLCGSDLHTVAGTRNESVPSILGHEILGTIQDVGDPPLRDVQGHPLGPGDRVTWSTAISCRQCDRCRSGLPQKCRELAKYGHEVAEGRCALSGGLAEYLLLRTGTMAVQVDPAIPDEVACPANCATATVAAAYRAAGEIAGRRVLILGAGLLGLTAAAFAKSHGASHTVVCDSNADRLCLATEFGADCAVEWHADLAELRMRLTRACENAAFDLIVELSGSPDAVEAACELGDIGAQVILVGTVMKSRPVRLDPERIVRNWLCVRGVHNYAPEDLLTAVEFLARYHGRFPFAKVVEESYLLSDVNQAIESAVNNRPVRVAIRPLK